MKTIVALGWASTYGWQVASQLNEMTWGQSDIIYTPNNPSIIDALDTHCAWVLPIENRYWWVVSESMEKIYSEKDNLKVLGCISLKINHILAKIPGTWEIQRVYSHPQALIQCQQKLSGMDVELIKEPSTVAAIDGLSAGDGVICSPLAVEKNNLEIIDDRVCLEDNETHFAILTKDLSIEKIPAIASRRVIAILNSVSDKPGALWLGLQILSDAGINMHFIRSEATWDKSYDFVMVMDRPDNIEQLQEDVWQWGIWLQVL